MNNKKSKIFYSGEVYRKTTKVNSQVGFEIYNSNNPKDDFEIIYNSAKYFKRNWKRGNISIDIGYLSFIETIRFTTR